MLRYLLGNTVKIGGNGHNACPPENLIKLNTVVKAYKTDAGDFLALKGVNLSIGSGEFVGVIGKSGSGKSTLINMIAGIDRPTKGEIFIGGTPIHKLGEGKMAKWRGRNLGIVFQFFQLLPMLTVVENVMLPMDFCNFMGSGQRRQRAMSLLEQVGVALGEPYSSALKGSSHALRELRPKRGASPLRVIYAFDPKREALLCSEATRAPTRGSTSGPSPGPSSCGRRT